MNEQIQTTTLTDYINTAKKELGQDYSDCMEGSIKDEYYNTIIADTCKNGGKITMAVFDSLEPWQKFHFNKHYNYRGEGLKP
jgi:hypothetical protein